MFGTAGSRSTRRPPENAILYAGAAATLVYDPNTSISYLSSCSISVPASNRERRYMVSGFFRFSGSHGVHTAMALDGAHEQYAQAFPAGSVTTVPVALGTLMTVPGDGKIHTIGIWIEDAGATGNLTFYERYVFAQPVSP